MEQAFRASTPLSSPNRRQRRAEAARSRSRARKHRPTRAQLDLINRTTDRFLAHGCDCCGAPAVPGLPVLCVPSGGDFLAVCDGCKAVHNMKPVVAVVPDAITDPWAEDDRDWFAANPGRSLRLRKTMLGELQVAAIDRGAEVPAQLPGHFWATVSYQIRPGERANSFHRVPIGNSIDGLSDLEIAAHCFLEGDLETAEQEFDDMVALSIGQVRADALIRRTQSRLAAFKEDVQ
ncbi:hypothetical protein [Skermanella pratensis]|uniref:hypothetical protein n=1 Tax=Skermanella pratensis TaxID=2233999 RepID=UPI001300ECFF|nr:hypothetical protein [Skermanella pratensis]